MYMSQIVKLKMLNVKLRWQHVMTYIMQISFTFWSSAAPTRHLILLPNGEAACALIINETFGNPSSINLMIFEGVLHDLICRTMNPPVSSLLNRSDRLKICHPHLFSHIWTFPLICTCSSMLCSNIFFVCSRECNPFWLWIWFANWATGLWSCIITPWLYNTD